MILVLCMACGAPGEACPCDRAAAGGSGETCDTRQVAPPWSPPASDDEPTPAGELLN